MNFVLFASIEIVADDSANTPVPISEIEADIYIDAFEPLKAY